MALVDGGTATTQPTTTNADDDKEKKEEKEDEEEKEKEVEKEKENPSGEKASKPDLATAPATTPVKPLPLGEIGNVEKSA